MDRIPVNGISRVVAIPGLISQSNAIHLDGNWRDFQMKLHQLTRFAGFFVMCLTSALAVTITSSMANRATAGMECPDSMQPVNEFRLFFGIVDDSVPVLSEPEWEQFVNHSITPGFKDGLTIYDATGQWLAPDGVLHHHVVKTVMAATYGDLNMVAAEQISRDFEARFDGLVFIMLNQSCAGILK